MKFGEQLIRLQGSAPPQFFSYKITEDI